MISVGSRQEFRTGNAKVAAMRDGERLLNVQEVARMLGCSQQYVRQLLRQGRLPGQKVGRDWVIPEKAARSATLRAEGRPRRVSRGARR